MMMMMTLSNHIENPLPVEVDDSINLLMTFPIPKSQRYRKKNTRSMQKITEEKFCTKLSKMRINW